MKTLKFSIISRLFLAISLLAGLLWSSPAAAVSPDKPISMDVPAAAGPLSLLTVPEVAAGYKAPTRDGYCDPASEYYGALHGSFVDGPDGTGAGNIYLLHDGVNLYVCIISPVGTNPTRFDSLYIDTQGDGSTTTYSQKDDYSLRMDYSGGKTTWIGNGNIGGWEDFSNDYNGLWAGTSSTGNFDIAEYSLPFSNFNLNVCSSIFRLAGYHHHFAWSGNDYGWPSAQYYDQPGTWQPLQLGSTNCGQNGSIAYVFRYNADAATGFYNLLTGAGYTVTLVKLSDVTSTNFSAFDLTIIADDTGSLDQWGTPPAATTGAAQVLKIKEANKPILGLGEGGYAFFGRLSMFIGWPHGWHGPQNFIDRASGYPPAIFSGVSSSPVKYYDTPTNSVGIYNLPSVPADVTRVGLEVPTDDHSSLIQQDCRMLWGNSGIPSGMTASPDGLLLFLNTVGYTRGQTCSTPPPDPDPACYTLVKSANSASGSTVTPGTTIEYTLTYQLTGAKGCPTTGKLVDYVPLGTSFQPWSATDGISPGADGALVWTVGTSAGTLTKTFKVLVMDTICNGNKTVANLAELQPSGAAPLVSNTTSHPVTCPPLGLPNSGPVFAEDELKVSPYPLFAGTPTRLSVRVRNLTTGALPVTVQFQVAPAATPLGSGLAYTTVATRSAILPGSSTLELVANYVPDGSGNRCFQAVVSTDGMTDLKTQSCLDLTEDFQPGVPDDLVMLVRNDTSLAKDYYLVVDNVCPGWSAVVEPATITSLAGGASQPVTLTVTPPNPLTMGSGCHIDVQVWNDGKLVGGVRKLDLPPVHLPANVLPPWEEPEITFVPEPPVAGTPGQICIQLQNPLGVSKVVTVNFSVADFGAGIGFTPAASLTAITLPANSMNKYCASWTPAAGGTLHRCVLATLVQANALNQVSQKNIDILPSASGDLGSLDIPFKVGNPGLAERGLSFGFNLVGIDPYWSPEITLPGGGPPPAVLSAGETIPLMLHFVPGSALSPSSLAPQYPASYGFGDLSSVEVSVLLGGIRESGFSIHLVTNRVYLPLIRR